MVDREALVGVVIAAGFGIAWTFWAASGLAGGAAVAVRVAGVVLGLLVVTGALRRRRTMRWAAAAPQRTSGSMFGSRGYRVSVGVEVVALFGGNAVLGAAGHGGYVAAWTALVVGVHFVGFGRLFTPMFYWLGAALLLAAFAGAAAGAATGSIRAVEATTGLIAALSLFLAGARGLTSTDQASIR